MSDRDLRWQQRLTEHAVHILPYRGLGSGIPRALHDWPDIELIDDVAANQFKVVVARPQPHVQVIAPVGIGPAQASVEQSPVTPEVTPEVSGEVARLLRVLLGEMTRGELQSALGLKDEKHIRDAYLRPALDGQLIEMTIAHKPRSRLQQYRLTAKGRILQAALREAD